MVKWYSITNNQQKLTENFKIGEFACKCSRCTEVLVDEALVEWLQKLRDYFGVPVNVNSGYRCELHNKAVGGAATSHHLRGMAADIRVKGISPEEVAKYAESIGIQRIGLYDNFVHIGSDTRKRFWLGHAGTNVDTFGQETEKTFSVTLPVLKRGAKGEKVKALQAHLVGYGLNIEVDGSFGPATEEAIKEYQQTHNLTVDGKAGPKTRNNMLGIK
jgi:hypothetical protein